MHAPNAFPTEHGQPLLLTNEQQAIVQCTQPSTVVAALAGTGKTTTLACCAVHAARRQADAKILVLAYSKAGVEAFNHRLRMLVRELPAQLHVTTLERWCARVLRQRDPQVRFVVDPLELRQHAQAALAHLHQQQEWHPEQYTELPSELDMQALHSFQRMAKKNLLLQRMDEEGVSLQPFCEEHQLDYGMAQLFLACERLRVDACGDTVFYAEGDCTYALATEAWDSAAPALADYDLVVLDEMHDMDLASLTVLRRILQPAHTRFLGAGDFNQHIEAQALSVFQDQLQRLAEFLPRPSQTLPLTLSRRFGAAIAEAVNRWFPVGMQAASNRRSSVTHLHYQDDAQCIAHLLHAHRTLVPSNPQDPIPLTVLLRHAHSALPLEWAIHQAGKTASLHGMLPFYLTRDIALLLGLLYAHGMQAAHWKSSTCLLPTDVLAAFIDGALYFGKGRIATGTQDTDLRSLARQMHAHPQGIWRFLIGNDHLQGGARNLAAFGDFLQLPLHLQADAQALLQRADVWGLYATTPLPPAEQQQLRARIEAFVQLVQGMSVPEVLQRVAAMAQRQAHIARKGGGYDFQLLSIEMAKGLEFEYVAIPFLEPGRFPAPSPHALAFLERNRLYVAMTRAKQRLWLLEHAQRPLAPWSS